MKKVTAVIVTYNRLFLLRRSLEAAKKQTYPIQNFLVINNGSSDGSAEWLSHQSGIVVVDQKINVGASGGFSLGIKAAIDCDCEWIWVMDDDTICEPDTLEKLVEKIDCIDDNIGFIGSNCKWVDGEPHLMNVPDIKPMLNKNPFNKYDEHNILLTASSSWVSLLLNARAVKEVGLPYKEFFFWSDDLEYTQRITKAGYLGCYCTDSVVVHETAKNYCPDFYRETLNNVWKYRYGFRNEFFLKKKNKGFGYFIFWLFAKVGYTSYKLIKIRKDHHLRFIAVLIGSAWDSIFFNPVVDKAGSL
jgi:rhamnopyranosyl-N-acetylglucosaminyl-diphospho-decaprenol beta-1,3/1,4-galactofuranosyltransferase